MTTGRVISAVFLTCYVLARRWLRMLFQRSHPLLT